MTRRRRATWIRAEHGEAKPVSMLMFFAIALLSAVLLDAVLLTWIIGAAS